MTHNSGHVLIVDPNKELHIVLANPITTLGYLVTIVEQGQQALVLLETYRFHLLIISATLPDMTSEQLLKRLKRKNHLSDLNIIMVSHEPIDIELYLKIGAKDWLQLPCSPTIIKNRLGTYLRQKQLEELRQLYQQELDYSDKLAKDLLLTILPLGAALSVESNFDKLLERILNEAKAICNADGGTLYLRTENNYLRFAIMVNDSLHIMMGGVSGKPVDLQPLPLYDAVTQQPNIYNISTYAAVRGESINVSDIYNNEDFDFSGTKAMDLRRGYRTISNLTIPLKNHYGQAIGVLQLLNAKDSQTNLVIPFDSYHQQVVEALASQAAVVLTNQMLMERQKELLSFERELKIAREIQMGFLPNELPQPTGWEIAAYYAPAYEVAGDFYDAFYLGDHQWVGLVIADVCDKGTQAALFMALIRSLIRAYSEQEANLFSPLDSANKPLETAAMATILENTINQTNRYILQNHSQQNMFATLFFGLLDPLTGLLSYVNGGHNAPIITNGVGLQNLLEPTGPAVGLMPNIKFQVKQITLAPHQTLLAYTDGVTDARNPQGKAFTTQHLLTVAAEPTSSATALIDYLQAQVRAHTAEANQYDDITMLVVRRVGA